MIADKLENSELYKSIHPKFSKAFEYLKNTDFSTVAPGKYEIEGDSVFAVVNEYETQHPSECNLEAHKNYIDIQFVHSGSEKIGFTTLYNQIPTKEYDSADDYWLFNEKVDFVSLNKGMFGVFYPNDLHMPGTINNAPEEVKKIVLKIKI